MDLIGERWSMPLIRELLLGPRRFGDLKTSLNGISANVLSQRLEGLEEAGVLIRRKLPPPASVQVYELHRGRQRRRYARRWARAVALAEARSDSRSARYR